MRVVVFRRVGPPGVVAACCRTDGEVLRVFCVTASRRVVYVDVPHSDLWSHRRLAESPGGLRAIPTIPHAVEQAHFAHPRQLRLTFAGGPGAGGLVLDLDEGLARVSSWRPLDDRWPHTPDDHGWLTSVEGGRACVYRMGDGPEASSCGDAAPSAALFTISTDDGRVAYPFRLKDVYGSLRTVTSPEILGEFRSVLSSLPPGGGVLVVSRDEWLTDVVALACCVGADRGFRVFVTCRPSREVSRCYAEMREAEVLPSGEEGEVLAANDIALIACAESVPPQTAFRLAALAASGAVVALHRVAGQITPWPDQAMAGGGGETAAEARHVGDWTFARMP